MFEVTKWLKAVRQNGSVWRTFKEYLVASDIKHGTLVGTDANGNKYYQNERDVPVLYRDRWIVYN